MQQEFNFNIAVIGLNHKTAPVEIREKIAFQENIIKKSLSQLMSNPIISEALILSTCNRVEIYVVSEDSKEALKQAVFQFISSFHKIPLEKFKEHLYIFYNKDAIFHLFRVGSSLDSMVVGEPQILGQLKDAYRIATEVGCTKTILNRLLHRAFFVAKRVRTETEISSSAVSISYAAVELAKKIFDDLKDKKILLLGAGEMCELAAKHLISNGVTEIFVANRTYERAEELANEFNGKPVNFENRYLFLEKVDIVISSTGAPHYILLYEEVKKIMKIRKNRPVFMIDIAVPRDIEPKINDIDNIYLYDIDDLKQVVERNWESRQNEAIKAEAIIEHETKIFLDWLKSLNVYPVIKNLRVFFETIKEQETEKFLKKIKNLSSEDKEIIKQLTHSLINKLLHVPTVNLKKKENLKHANAIIELFNLKMEENNEN